MSSFIRCFPVIVLMLSVSSLARAQEGSADFPSVSAKAGHVYISNRTNQEISFYLASAHTKRTEHKLKPGRSATFSGDSRDQWFNIEIYSGPNNYRTQYGLNVGTRNYIDWSGGILDVFRIPPK